MPPHEPFKMSPHNLLYEADEGAPTISVGKLRNCATEVL